MKYRKENGDTRALIDRSFFNAELKALYGSHYADRLKMAHAYERKIIIGDKEVLLDWRGDGISFKSTLLSSNIL